MSDHKIIDVAELLVSGPVQWIHPSYRDLVIDELARDESLRLPFLKKADLQGIKIALSQAGGSAGDRQLPLLHDDKSWDAVHSRCVEIISLSGPDEAVNVLRVLRSAAVDVGDNIRSRIATLVAACCDSARRRWDKDKVALTSVQLREFFNASVLAEPLPVAPVLAPSWTRAYASVRASITNRSQLIDGRALLEWATLSALIAENEPRYLKQVDFPNAYIGDVAQLLSIIDQESEFEPETDDADDVKSEADRFDSITAALEMLQKLFPGQAKQIRETLTAASAQEDYLRELYHQMSADPRDDDDYEPSESESRSERFDIETLFSDL